MSRPFASPLSSARIMPCRSNRTTGNLAGIRPDRHHHRRPGQASQPCQGAASDQQCHPAGNGGRGSAYARRPGPGELDRTARADASPQRGRRGRSSDGTITARQARCTAQANDLQASTQDACGEVQSTVARWRRQRGVFRPRPQRSKLLPAHAHFVPAPLGRDLSGSDRGDPRRAALQLSPVL